VLCRENGHITRPSELEIFYYSKECIDKIHQHGYLAIVITNQSGVARGLYTEEELIEYCDYMKKTLDLDAIYYCPHHPQGIVPKYKIICECRKPKIGLITRACMEYDINLTDSIVVGDRASDIILGNNIGAQTVLLNSGYGANKLEEMVEFDYLFDNLREFTINLSNIK